LILVLAMLAAKFSLPKSASKEEEDVLARPMAQSTAEADGRIEGTSAPHLKTAVSTARLFVFLPLRMPT
jgi:hypothetical protein